MISNNINRLHSATAEMNMPMKEFGKPSKIWQAPKSIQKYAEQPKHAKVLLSIKSSLVLGIDYYKLRDSKTSRLLTPGAEKICRIMNLKERTTILNAIQDKTDDFVAYIVKVELLNDNGLAESEGFGTCNSIETKFLKFRAFDVTNIVLHVAHDRALLAAVTIQFNAFELLNDDS